MVSRAGIGLFERSYGGPTASIKELEGLQDRRYKVLYYEGGVIYYGFGLVYMGLLLILTCDQYLLRCWYGHHSFPLQHDARAACPHLVWTGGSPEQHRVLKREHDQRMLLSCSCSGP